MLVGELQAEVVLEIVVGRMLPPKLGGESPYRWTDHNMSLHPLAVLARYAAGRG
jgi:hypothetical protein